MSDSFMSTITSVHCVNVASCLLKPNTTQLRSTHI